MDFPPVQEATTDLEKADRILQTYKGVSERTKAIGQFNDSKQAEVERNLKEMERDFGTSGPQTDCNSKLRRDGIPNWAVGPDGIPN